MADTVGNDQEVPAAVERLVLAEQLAGKQRAQKRAAFARSAVQDEHRIPDLPFFIPFRLSDRAEVHPKRRQRFSGGELEILYNKVAFNRRWKLRCMRPYGCCENEENTDKCSIPFHLALRYLYPVH